MVPARASVVEPRATAGRESGPQRQAGATVCRTSSQNSACTRRSPVSSGWNAVASTEPCRTATTRPAAAPASAPVRVAAERWRAPDRGPDRLDPRRPDEHRAHRAVRQAGERAGRSRTSRPGGRTRCAAPRRPGRRAAAGRGGRRGPRWPAGSSRRTSRRPASRRRSARAAGRAARTSASSRLIVVDSPPGITSASTASSSDGRRTGTARSAARRDGRHVLADVTLQGEHTDHRNHVHQRTSPPASRTAARLRNAPRARLARIQSATRARNAPAVVRPGRRPSASSPRAPPRPPPGRPTRRTRSAR